MEQFAFLREIIDDLPQEDADFIEPLMQSAAESVFGTPGIGGLLVIDGLDESVMLSRPGGLQWLFNTLNGFAISVLLTARTEFWQQRIDDFSIPVGERSTKPGAPQRDSRVRLVELRPWGKTQMLSLARMFRDSRYIDEERENIDRFIDLVEKDRYKELYGDIPTRPLFLRYLLETVAESGIQMTGRIALLHEWVRRKIARDYNEPLKHGEGRLSVLDRNEALGVRLELSFRAMVHASAAMSTIVDGALILLPTCLVETALSRDKYFHDVIDPLGLFLNSLLVPVSGIGLSTEMRFAHQVIHEFFLAKHIAGNPSVYSNVKIPANVKQWIIS